MTIPNYTPQTWVNGPAGMTPINADRLNHMEAGIAIIGSTLVPTAVMTDNYTAKHLDLVRCDTTTRSFNVQLPTAAINSTTIAVKMIVQGGINTVTILCGGTDVINKVGGSTSYAVPMANQLVLLEYFSGIWTVINDSLPLSGLDARYAASGVGLVLSDVAATVFASGALVVGKHNPVDAAGATRAMTLANASKAGLLISVEKFDTSANAVSVTGLIRGVAATTITMVRQNETRLLLSKADGSWWPVASNKSSSSLIYTDVGLSTSTAADIAATSLRTITDPFGAGVGYRVKCYYVNGNVAGAAGVRGQVSIYVNGVQNLYGIIVAASSAVSIQTVSDFPAGGTNTFQGWLVSKDATLLTYADAKTHRMVTEVTPLP